MNLAFDFRIHRMKRLTACLAVTFGCSADKRDAPDASIAGHADAPIDAVPLRCDLTGPFGTPVPVPGINTTAEENGAWLSVDELRIYFTLGPVPLNPDMRDLYVASRTTTSEAFGTAMQVPGVNSALRDQQPSLSPDELTLFLSRGSTTDIYVASRPDTQSPFSTPVAVSGINDTQSYDDSPWISADGLVLYLASTRSGNFNYEPYMATRASLSAPFGPPTTAMLTALSSPANDSQPIVRGDGLELFFASNRDQIMYPEGYTNDIYRSTRSSVTEPFGAPTRVTELAAPTNEGPTWISQDGCVLVFASSRTGAGSYDLWMTSR